MRTHAEAPAHAETARAPGPATAPPLYDPPAPASSGHSFSRLSIYAAGSPLLQRMPAGEPQTEAPAPEPAAAPATEGLLLEDDAPAAEGKMHKSEFLTALREALCQVAEQEVGAVCPGIDLLFAKYGPRPAAEIESVIRRTLPNGGAATAAQDYLPLLAERVRRAIRTWKTTGAITDLPPGFDTAGLPVEPPGPPAGPPPEPGQEVARKAREGGAPAVVDSPRAIQYQLGPGRPLDSSLQARLSPAVGLDLSAVRIHTDTAAARLSSRLDARAFTVGSHVAFAPGEFQPGTPVGDALLAHELAHVAQQSGAADAASYEALEADADHSAIGAVLSLWGNLRTNTLPALKSGLRLQRCETTSKGAVGATRAADAKANFRKNNSKLSTAELDKIDSALSKATSDNFDIIISFYDYFSNHDVVKEPSLETRGLDGETKPHSDMVINPKLLDPATSDTRLGATLLHEYSHTRHDTNYMGASDYQEGDSYGIEYFFAERNGETARISTIASLISTPGKLSLPAMHAALVKNFRLSYATLVALYEVIDGKTPRAGLAGVSKDDASQMAARLIDTGEDSRPADLKKIMTWVESNLTSFTLPV